MQGLLTSCGLRQFDLLGIKITATNYEEATDLLITSAKGNRKAIVSAFAVHGLTVASLEKSFASKINSFDMIVPDGQPVRWALNLLYKAKLADRVYGPELMLYLCRQAAACGVGVYLYGSYNQVVDQLCINLKYRFPNINIVGKEPSAFRVLSAEEDQSLVERINKSGAKIIFLGLGCPLQEAFAYDHRSSINGIQVCVGAAFDFHAGNKKMAPSWMQRNGLEWLFRLGQEPTRLWRRYLITNSIFILKVALQLIKKTNPPQEIVKFLNKRRLTK